MERNQVFPCCKSILCRTLTKLQKDFNCTAYTLYMWKYLYNVTTRTSLSMARASTAVCLQLCAIYATQFTLIISLWSFQSTVGIVHTSPFSPPFVLQLSACNPISLCFFITNTKALIRIVYVCSGTDLRSITVFLKLWSIDHQWAAAVYRRFWKEHNC
jgi:hypothetical protein